MTWTILSSLFDLGTKIDRLPKFLNKELNKKLNKEFLQDCFHFILII